MPKLLKDKENDLIKKVKESSDEKERKNAFDELFCAYKNSIKGFITVRVRNDDDAKDIFQNTWLKVLVNLQKGHYDPKKGSFYTWVRAIAENEIKNYFRKKGDEISLLEEDFEKPYNQEIAEVKPLLIKLNLYENLLKLLFKKGGYPWQVIVFGFTKLLEWKPSEIVKELSDNSLEELATKLEADYISLSGLPEGQVKCAFSLLHSQMCKLVKDIISPHDSETFDMVQKKCITGKKVGETKLKDYFGSNPEHNISVWVNRVKKRMRREAVEHKIDI